MADPSTLLGMLALAVIGTGGAAWIWAVVQVWQGRPILPLEARRPVPWGLVDLVLVVGAFLLVFLLVSIAAVVLMPGAATELQDAARADSAPGLEHLVKGRIQLVPCKRGCCEGRGTRRHRGIHGTPVHTIGQALSSTTSG